MIWRLALAMLLLLMLAGCPPRSYSPYEHPRELTHQPAEGALGPYSGAVITSDFVFASGKIGQRDGDFAREVNTALDAVESELERAGAGLRDLVSVTVYLTDMANYARFNEIYAARVPQPYPARAVVAVEALPGEAQVEIQAIARRHSR